MRDPATQENASEDEVQELWAKVLAGEIRSPGAYSLHTLSFLARLQREDILVLERVAPFVCRNVIPKLFLGKYVSYDDALYLESLGLLLGASAGIGGLTFKLKSRISDQLLAIMECHGKSLIFNHDDPNLSLSTEVTSLSKVAREIFTIGKFSPNDEALTLLGKTIAAGRCKVFMGHYIPVDNDHIQLFKHYEIA